MKRKIWNRLASLVLVLVVAAVLPMMTMTVSAASEVPQMVDIALVTYTDGTTQYLRNNDYLYKVTFTNLKGYTQVAFSYSPYGYLQLFSTEISYIVLRKDTNGTTAETSDLPTSQGSSCFYYTSSQNYANDKNKPIVIITCVALSEPVWSWASDNSSAQAVFTVNEANVCATVDASVTSSTVSASDCSEKDKTTYTATVTFNGQQYTDTKTVESAGIPHSLVYSASGNTVTETCENGCGHNLQATLQLKSGAELTYTGSAIQPMEIVYPAGWQGVQVQPQSTDYTNNIHASTAVCKVSYADGVILTNSFEIVAADIADATVSVSPTEEIYGGEKKPQTLQVYWNGAALTENIDYTLQWDKTPFEAADTYTATITGIGNFRGTNTARRVMHPATLTDVKVEQVGTLTYDGGKALTPVVAVTAKAANNQPVTFTYSKAQYGTYGSMPVFTVVGTYTVYFKASAPNHEDAFGSFVVFVKKAANQWETQPSIDDWTYGDAASTPVYKASFGTVSIQYSGTANDGSVWNSETAPTKAGSYTATFTVTDTENYSGLSLQVNFTVERANYDMSGAKWDYAHAFKHDGQLHSVWVDESSLPYGVQVSNYTGNTADEVGKYTANVSLSYDYDNYNRPDFDYLLEWEIKKDWSRSENAEKVKDVTPENVTPADKADLQSAKADLEKALNENGEIYTDDEKKAISDELKRIEDALKVLGVPETGDGCQVVLWTMLLSTGIMGMTWLLMDRKAKYAGK